MPHDKGADQGTDAWTDMHNRATGKIQRAHLTQPSATPNPMGDRSVDHHGPEGREQQQRWKTHSFRKCAGN